MLEKVFGAVLVAKGEGGGGSRIFRFLLPFVYAGSGGGGINVGFMGFECWV